jgi:hypothetical protein
MENVCEIQLLNRNLYKTLPIELIFVSLTLAYDLCVLRRFSDKAFVTFLILEIVAFMFTVGATTAAIVAIGDAFLRCKMIFCHWAMMETLSWYIEATVNLALCFLLIYIQEYLAVFVTVECVILRGFLIFSRCNSHRSVYVEYEKQVKESGLGDPNTSPDYKLGFRAFVDFKTDFHSIAKRKLSESKDDTDFIFGLLDAARVFAECECLKYYIQWLQDSLAETPKTTCDPFCALWMTDRGFLRYAHTSRKFTNANELLDRAIRLGRADTVNIIFDGIHKESRLGTLQYAEQLLSEVGASRVLADAAVRRLESTLKARRIEVLHAMFVDNKKTVNGQLFPIKISF